MIGRSNYRRGRRVTVPKIPKKDDGKASLLEKAGKSFTTTGGAFLRSYLKGAESLATKLKKKLPPQVKQSPSRRRRPVRRPRPTMK